MQSDFFTDGAGKSIVDVPAFFDSDIYRPVAELVSMGVLVSFGSTRDRGAISVSVTTDGRRRREYFRDSAEATDFLRLAVAAVRGTGSGNPAGDLPPVQRSTRGRQKAS